MSTTIMTGITILISLTGGIIGLLQYIKGNKLKRAAYFGKLKQEFNYNKHFQKIVNLLEEDKEELKEIPYEHKRNFLGFYERISIALNTGLIKPGVAHYLFGYYAIRCEASTNFWEGKDGVDKSSIYWSEFIRFANEMKKIQKKMGCSKNRKTISF